MDRTSRPDLSERVIRDNIVRVKFPRKPYVRVLRLQNADDPAPPMLMKNLARRQPGRSTRKSRGHIRCRGDQVIGSYGIGRILRCCNRGSSQSNRETDNRRPHLKESIGFRSGTGLILR